MIPEGARIARESQYRACCLYNPNSNCHPLSLPFLVLKSKISLSRLVYEHLTILMLDISDFFNIILFKITLNLKAGFTMKMERSTIHRSKDQEIKIDEDYCYQWITVYIMSPKHNANCELQMVSPPPHCLTGYMRKDFQQFQRISLWFVDICLQIYCNIQKLSSDGHI